jgi:hypothetical protein
MIFYIASNFYLVAFPDYNGFGGERFWCLDINLTQATRKKIQQLTLKANSRQKRIICVPPVIN